MKKLFRIFLIESINRPTSQSSTFKSSLVQQYVQSKLSIKSKSACSAGKYTM